VAALGWKSYSQKSSPSFLKFRMQTEGGHGGPPLQFIVMKLIFLVLCVAVCANAQTLSSPAAFVVPEEKSKPIAIPKFDKPPTIDGKLDEEVWQTAAVLKDFYQIQPGDNTPPSKPTEVLIGFDPKFLYIAQLETAIAGVVWLDAESRHSVLCRL